ncbi:MAG: zinc ribbon domain-containing protein [Clostridiales bacterium]|nr:zinc ribbon domain-containing protein [Clostridiales bacterium]
MFCEQCGKEIPDNSKFCAGCGAIVEPAEPMVQAVEPETEPVPTPEPVEAPNPQQVPPPPRPQPQPVSVAQTSKAQYSSKDNLIKPLSIGSYIGIIILMSIPIINLIMLLVWSFSDTVNLNKKHFAIAVLIMILISILITVGLVILAATVGGGIYQYYFWQ